MMAGMPSQPTGDVPPADGSLPGDSARAWGDRDFGIYVHVPFCASRCGYCDFNTYTAPELAGANGVDRATFAEHLAGEVGFARQVLGDRDVPVRTVFVGGGTPTLLAPDALGSVLERIHRDRAAGIASDANFAAWLADNPWVRSYAAFRSLEHANGGVAWEAWGDSAADPAAAVRACWADRPQECRFHAWVQREAGTQLAAAAVALERMGVRLKGDLPTIVRYVAASKALVQSAGMVATEFPDD